MADNKENFGSKFEIIAAAAGSAIGLGNIDDELTAKAYIVPGLGDAGDLAYGEKE